jgi:hypothetical protein
MAARAGEKSDVSKQVWNKRYALQFELRSIVCSARPLGRMAKWMLSDFCFAKRNLGLIRNQGVILMSKARALSL